MNVVDESRNVVRAVKAATITSLGRAAAYIRGIARRSISSRKKAPPSLPGKPPRSPTGRLKDAIVFSVDRPAGAAVIGPTLSVLGRIGHTHEFGGTEPPKGGRPRGAPFAIRLGGHGPLRVTTVRSGRTAGGRFVRAGEGGVAKQKLGVGRLATQAQVQRAERIAGELNLPPSQTGVPIRKARVYPSRPFMGPALALSRERLPSFWSNVLKRS